jgi:hypothetical protein
MTADISAPVTVSHIATMGELMSTHPSLLDKAVFMHTFHQKIHSKSDPGTYFIKHHTNIYNNITVTVTQVHTPIYMKKCYQSFYTSSSKFHTSNS